MAKLKNEQEDYTSLISDIEKGQLKIPQFQRDFVWDLSQTAQLIDSMLKGYPIGTFIFWRTDERLRSIRNIGDKTLRDPNDGELVNYVLDGQQRITSIYAVLTKKKIIRGDNTEVDYTHVYIDLGAGEDDPIIITNVDDRAVYTYIQVVDLLEGSITSLSEYPKKYHKKIEHYKLRLTGYLFSVISLEEASIDVATDVFTRLNVGGKSLTLFEVMVAKTYDAEKNFDLAEKYDELMEELEICGYSTIPEITVLQVVSTILVKECVRNKILKLPKNEIIEVWDEAIDAIRMTIDYFRSSYQIRVSRMLPYNALIVPFSYYFYKKKTKPTGDVQRKLTDMFWRISLGGRYSSGTESKIAQDIVYMNKILSGSNPKYKWEVRVEPQEIIDNGRFGTGRSYIKSILAIMAAKAPKSFDDNATVIIDNSHLKITTSRNYHHFFPKAYMRKKQSDVGNELVDNIVNITIVDDFLNKRKIKDNPPSKYMKGFMRVNDKLANTMKTHLIGDFETFGVLDDDYDKFLDKRAKLISKEIKKRLIIDEDTDKNWVTSEADTGSHAEL